MPLSSDNYIIELPTVVQLQFRSRRAAAAMVGATMFTIVLGLTCWIQLIVSTAHHPSNSTALDLQQGAADCLVLGPAEHASESKSVYIYIANDPSMDEYGVHLWARPGLNQTSHVYYNTEDGRLDMRISMGSAVTVQIRHD